MLRDDPSIIIKGEKRSAVAVWDRKNYLRETNSQLSDKVYREGKRDTKDPLTKLSRVCLESLGTDVTLVKEL